MCQLSVPFMLPYRSNRLRPIHYLHHRIYQDDVEVLTLCDDQVHHLRPIARQSALEALFRESTGDNFGVNGLVVDDEDFDIELRLFLFIT
jgi:hypothetical protein